MMKKIMTFKTGNTKGTDHCIIGDIGKAVIKSHLIGCTGEIVGFTISKYSQIFDEKVGNYRLRHQLCSDYFESWCPLNTSFIVPRDIIMIYSST